MPAPCSTFSSTIVLFSLIHERAIIKKMKTTKHILLTALLMLLSTTLFAQPASVKKAAQSVFSLTTFNADGSILGTSYGAFITPSGTGLAMWHLFKGAHHAVVTDASGQQHDVEAMLGASEVYDLCTFRVRGAKAAALPLATTDAAAQQVYLVGYDVKKPTIQTVTPLRSEKFNTTLNYYVFNDVDISGTMLGCPIVNGMGQLLGIAQRPAEGGQAFAADARLTSSFALSGLSINDPVMRATGIRTALPADENQATLMLMLAGQQTDSVRYDAYVDEFIHRFPTSTEGYTARATRLVSQRRLADADQVFQQCVKQAAKKDEAYSNYAKTVYQATLYRVDTTFTKWSLGRALELAQEAYKVNALPIYQHQQAQILYSEGKTEDALSIFTLLQQTDLGKNGEVYYEAAQCKQRLGRPKEEVLALINSAISVQPGSASAPYVLARGRMYDEGGEYRKAFQDYLTYDTLVNNNGTAEFYYVKYQCEMKIRQYKLALNDIAHAIVLTRTEPLYYAEMAALQLRVNMLQEAVQTCDMGLGLDDQNPNFYIIKGIALGEQAKTKSDAQAQQHADAVACLQKAKELGDERAEGLLKKYQ